MRLGQKCCFFCRYWRTRTCSDYIDYKANCNKVKTKLRAAQLSYEQSLLNRFQSNPTLMLCLNKSGVGPLERSDGSNISLVAMKWTNILNPFHPRRFIFCTGYLHFRFEGFICDVNISESLVLQKLCSTKLYDSIHFTSLRFVLARFVLLWLQLYVITAVIGQWRPPQWLEESYSNSSFYWRKAPKFKAIKQLIKDQ